MNKLYSQILQIKDRSLKYTNKILIFIINVWLIQQSSLMFELHDYKK